MTGVDEFGTGIGEPT